VQAELRELLDKQAIAELLFSEEAVLVVVAGGARRAARQ
jgi:hypothetical protein